MKMPLAPTETDDAANDAAALPDDAAIGASATAAHAADCTLLSALWHPSAGVPVGCLLVPSAHMKLVKATLHAAGKEGTQWLRRDGVQRARVGADGAPSSGADGVPPAGAGVVFEVHLSLAGAARLEAHRNVPCALSELLLSGQIRWMPGVRLRRSRAEPRLTATAAAMIQTAIAAAVMPAAAAAGVHSPTTALDPKPAADAAETGRRPCSFRFAELFAGIGGFRVALEALGGACVFASEMDPHAAATYALNFGALPEAGDITEVEAADLPPHDLLVGGFPCQCFSLAGEQLGLSDDARGQLYLECCRILCTGRPAAFLLENVVGLFTLDGGVFHREYEQRRPGRVHERIVADLSSCGYVVQSAVLGAHAFGVPQFRDRLFLVGFRSADAASRFEWPHNHSHPADCCVDSCRPLRSILEPDDSVAVRAASLTTAQYAKVRRGMVDGSRVARLDRPSLCLMSSYRSGWTRQACKLLRTCQGKTVLHDDRGMHRGAVVGIYGGAAPADATDGAESNGNEGVSGEGGGGEDGGGEECGDATNGKMAGGAGGHNEGAEPAGEGARGEGARFYTAREATRLMGFPESFRIPGHPTPEHGGPAYEAHERYFRQIGNAVCPPVVEAVARQMLRALNVQFQVHEEEETL